VHHVVLERWSRGRSWVHARDPRAKIAGLLVFLVLVATSQRSFALLSISYLLVLLATACVAGLPVKGVLARAAVVLPFSLVFAFISLLGGEPGRAAALLGKSYLSGLAVVLVVSTTTLPKLLRGLESLGVPRFLLMVSQFLYRYLFVISAEAQHMRAAAVSRGAFARGFGGHGSRFRAAAGAVGVLFARSYARAEDIHRSMAARGFQGRFPSLAGVRFGWRDSVFLLAAIILPSAIRLALEGWAP
jgi:cobalt/nickel transport system permease protein